MNGINGPITGGCGPKFLTCLAPSLLKVSLPGETVSNRALSTFQGPLGAQRISRNFGRGGRRRRAVQSVLGWKSHFLFFSLCFLVLCFGREAYAGSVSRAHRPAAQVSLSKKGSSSATNQALSSPIPLITYVGSSTTKSTAVKVPAGVQSGDLLLAFYSYWSHVRASPPAGWTLLSSSMANGSGVETVWYRFANNDAPGSSYSWSFSGSTPYQAGAMLAYRGADSATLQDGYCNNQGYGTLPTLCSFTTANSPDLYVGFFATENTNLTLPSDLSGRVVMQYSNGINFGAAAADKILPSPEMVPADSGSMNSAGWATVAVGLKAGSPGPVPTATATPVPTRMPTIISMPTSAPTMIVAPTLLPTSTAIPSQGATPTPTPTSGAISFVGSTSSGGTNLLVPAGVQNGDLLLAFYSYWSHASATAPAGWSPLSSSVAGNSGVETVWYRFASNDAAGSKYVWSFAGWSPYEAGGMLAYRGVDPAALQDGGCNNQGWGTLPSLCSFTNENSSDLYVGFVAAENNNLKLAPDLTGRVVTQYSNGINFGAAAGDKPLVSPGTVPADLGSINWGGWATVAIALKAISQNPIAGTPIPTGTPSGPNPPPTIAPTFAPTVAPTTIPTIAPTVAPTPIPTGLPTSVPTVTPTAIATTTAPTIAPTAVPTASPTTQPAVSMIAPANNSIVQGTISVSAQINSSAVSWISFYSDGVLIASSPPTSIMWDSTTVLDGPHTLSVTAYGVGNVNLGYASTNITVLNHSVSATTTPASTPIATWSNTPTSTPTPAGEVRPTNQIPNNTMPSASDLAAFHSGVGACGSLDDCTYMQAVDGQFTGTTTAIIEFEADKWCPNCTILNPFDGQTYSFRDLGKAIAVNETNWYQWRSANLTSPDPMTGLITLTPSRGDLGNVTAAQPYAGSWGIFQIAEGLGQGWPSSWPLSAKSTAFNADFKFAEQMGVEQGHLPYLNDPGRAQIAIANGFAPYTNYTDANGVLYPASTDVNQRRWGAVGNWFSGGWYDSGAVSYINQVQQILHNQPWTQPGF